MTFKVQKSSFKRKSDGSYSVSMKCPIAECAEKFIVTHKAYPGYYKHKKNHKLYDRKSKAPKWQVASITKHLSTAHSTNMSVNDQSRLDETFSDDTMMSDSNALNQLVVPESNEPSDVSQGSEIHQHDESMDENHRPDKTDNMPTEDADASALQTENMRVETRNSEKGKGML